MATKRKKGDIDWEAFFNSFDDAEMAQMLKKRPRVSGRGLASRRDESQEARNCFDGSKPNRARRKTRRLRDRRSVPRERPG